MFISNQATPAETLAELLAMSSRDETDTARFKAFKHDKHLCPGFRRSIRAMMDAYKSHRTDVQTTQGPRDNGVDVLLTYKYDVESRRVGLQMKSYSEIQDYASGKDPGFVKNLKAQYAAAVQRVDDYYIVLCTDEVAHAGQIQTLSSEIAGWEKLKIILPSQALSFFEMTPDDVRAFVTRLLCEQDAVLEAALAAVDPDRPTESLMKLACVCRLLSTGVAELDDTALTELFVDATGDTSADGLPDLLWDLPTYGLEMIETAGYRIDLALLPSALCAIYFDSLVRHNRSEGEMVDYLARLLGLR
ncbi:hypothetical protein [Caulobacter sp. Root1472]|uniref:hypothetical protein n=1 Tax=Caulobacter sp. Root1472 TaxID=1736470 RepID=UPI0006F2E22E|nr:hypothetical protein [Caulobacter sp. Root1472]KQZ28348.1 hypothetical protein ASD47_22220 [Caulobacter sp. Root1472]